MEVVDALNVWMGREGTTDFADAHPLGRSLEQHAAGVLEQPVRGAQHQRCHEQCGDAVSPDEAGRENEDAPIAMPEETRGRRSRGRE